MQELEDIYSDLCAILSEAIFSGADIISAKVKWYIHLLGVEQINETNIYLN